MAQYSWTRQVASVVGGPVGPVRGPEVTPARIPLGRAARAGSVGVGRGQAQHLAVVAEQPGHLEKLPGRGPASGCDSDAPVTTSVPMVAASRRYRVAIEVHLIDGTYELFRHFFGVPSHLNRRGQEVAAAPRRAVVGAGAPRRRGDARGGGDGSRHRVVPQRHVAGVQDRCGRRPAAAGSVWPARGGTLDAMGVVVWPMVDARGGRRHGVGGRGGRCRPRPWSG